VKSHRLASSRVPKRAVKTSRTSAASPGGRTPPSGRRIVWSATVGWTAAPSTVALVIARAPMRARTLLRSRRSIGSLSRLTMAIRSSTASVRFAKRSVARTS
jgi:hypothetical protein